MSKVNSFRFDRSVEILIDDLSGELKLSKTNIIEQSVILFAKEFNKKKSKSKLIKYAGIMKDADLLNFEKIISRKTIKKPLNID